MMDLIERLKQQNVSMWLNGEKIQLAFGENKPTPNLIAEIKGKKPQLTKFLAEQGITSQLAFFKLSTRKKTQPSRRDSASNAEEAIEAIFPATSLQQGFVFHHLTQPKDTAYRVQITWDYHARLNVNAWIDAWKLASLRYPALRTAFDWKGDILQIVHKETGIEAEHFSFHDLSAQDNQGQLTSLEQLKHQDLHTAFDLSKPGLMRFIIIKRQEDLYSVIKTEHHSIADGWSGPVLLQVVHSYYEQLIKGIRPEVTRETTYIEAQKWFARQASATKEYWHSRKNQLGSVNDINPLLTHHYDLSVAAHQGEEDIVCQEQDIRIVGDDYLKLKSMCKSLGVTLNAAVQFAWHKLLHSYTGDESTIVGTTVSGRDIPIDGIESSVGLYINTLPLQINWSKSVHTSTLLEQVHSSIAELNSHSRIPLSELHSNGERLFHSLLVFENYPMPAAGNAQQSEKTLAESMMFADAVQNVDYPMMILAYEQHEYVQQEGSSPKLYSALVIKLQYGQKWLSHKDAKRLTQQLHVIITGLAEHLHESHQSIPLTTKDERAAMLQFEPANLDDNWTLHKRFEVQVEKTPDNIALYFDKRSWTYRELNQQANQLAWQIRAQLESINPGQTKGNLVALYFDRNEHMLLSLLAVAKAGATWVPVSPQSPHDRSAYILEDTKALLLLTQRTYLATCSQFLEHNSTKPQVIAVDTRYSGSTENLPGYSQPEDLAYVIFTSGTTGRPKGVAISHRASVGRNLTMAQRGQTKNNIYLFKTSYIFDVSVSDIFSHLYVGASLVMTKAVFDVPEILSLIERYQINTCHFVPTQFSALTAAAGKQLAMERLYFSGENLSSEQLSLIDFNQTRVVNYYGPTETGEATSYIANANGESIIGEAFPGVRVYVVHESGQLAPPEMPGELYISGPGLASGYLNKEKLTAEVFRANPWSSDPGHEVCYKTGDRVCWLSGDEQRLTKGNLKYLGRADKQVKIRGYRIEPAEIEHCLLSLADIDSATVTAWQNGNEKSLAAYLIANDGRQIDVLSVRERISQTLPDYMVPTSFMQLEKLPLTINGKLNYTALPEPTASFAQSYIAPHTEQEKELCQIWQQILKLEQVGIEDNFFQVGGNSINAIKLIAAIRDNLSIDLPLSQLYQNPTIARFSQQVKGQLSEVIEHHKLSQYPLSFAQSRLWFMEKLEGGADAYHIPYLAKLAVNTKVDTLQLAINRVVQRHEVLNSVYLQDEQNNSYFAVRDESINIVSTRTITMAEVLQRIQLHSSNPFDLSREPSLRIHHYSCAETSDEYLLLLFHHIGFDGWSLDIFLQELAEAWHALGSERQPHFEPLSINYGDYAVWQQTQLQGDSLTSLSDYWKTALKGYENLRLFTDMPRPARPDFKGKDLVFELDQQLSDGLKNLAKSQHTTLYTLMLSALYCALSAISGQDDIIVGSPSDNRDQGQTQALIGFFVNSLALRAQVQRNQTLAQFIASIHEIVMGAKAHQAMPFEKLVEILEVERDVSRHPLFQVMFSVQNFGQQDNDLSDHQQHSNGQGASTGLPFLPVDFQGNEPLYTPAKVDLNIGVTEQNGRLFGVVNYATSLFKAQTAERFLNLYKQILLEFVNPSLLHRAIDKLSLLSQQDIAEQTQNTSKVFPYPSQTLQELFEQQVLEQPDAPALIFNQQGLSYQQLNERANRLARAILASSVDPESHPFVCLYLNRSFDVVIAILAVLKARMAWVPISTEYPPERVNYILQDTGARLVITHDDLVSTFEEVEVITLGESQQSHFEGTNLALDYANHDLAYVIYTSGTTGQPKGVMVEHRGVVNFLTSTQRKLQLQSGQAILWLTSYVFDPSVQDIFLALTNGCICVIPSETDIKAVAPVKALINKHQVVITAGTPSYLEILGQELDHSSLRHVFCGGEVMTTEVKRLWGGKLVNIYGPTETTIAATYDFDGARINCIGEALDNVTLYILNEQKQLLPFGAPGELYIGGAGVSRGYLNRPGLTAEKFIDNPCGDGKLYKTGDVVRWTKHGEQNNLEFYGRNDDQVKIRGFRIELGEVQSALNTLVQQAVVVDTVCTGEKILAAYIVDEATIVPSKLKSELAKSLPDHMIPAAINQIDKIPLTINGKLDRKALPEPLRYIDQEYKAPEDKLQSQLCEFWQQVLAIPRVGISDNFFAIGGNSISAIKLSSFIRNALHTELPLAVLYEHQNIERLAAYIQANVGELINIPKNQDIEHYPLSFAQERLLFIESFEQGTHVYHIPYLVELADNVDIARLEKALQQVCARHPVLQSVYLQDEQDNWYQKPLDNGITIQQVNLKKGQELSDVAQSDIQQTFDFANEAPLRVKVYHQQSHRYLLMLWHHIAFDGWSKEVFINELHLCYHQQLQKLPELDIQYGDFAIWQREYLSDQNKQNTLKQFWRKQLSGLEPLELLTDKVRPALVDYRGEDIFFAFDETLSLKLKQVAREHHTTVFSVLLSGFCVTLATVTGRSDIVVGTPSDNRHHAQTQNLIGFFVNSLVLRYQYDSRKDISQLLQEVHQQVARARVHQDFPFEQIPDLLEIDRDTGRHPVFQVMFTSSSIHSNASQSTQPTDRTATSEPLFKELSYESTQFNPAKYDLSLFTVDGDVISGCFNFAVSLFEKETIQRMASLYRNIMTAIADCLSHNLTLGDISLLTGSCQKKLLHDWNPKLSQSADASIPDIFFNIVQKKPDAIAIRYQNKTFTYRELDTLSNTLAKQIHNWCTEQTGRTSFALQAPKVVLYYQRSFELVVAQLAVLKAGAAYVPVSPDYPQSRTSFMLQEAQTSLILSDNKHISRLAQWCEHAGLSIPIQEPDFILIPQEVLSSVDVSPCAVHADDLAYVMYTSGTTGKPKGVMVPHRGVVSLAHKNPCLPILPDDVLIHLSNPNFDASTFEIWGALLNGACLTIAEADQQLDAESLENLLDTYGISTLWLTKSLFDQLYLANENLFAALRTLIIGGEALDPVLINRFVRQKQRPEKILNGYGPTESTTFTTLWDCQPFSGSVPIGKPMATRLVYVLNEALQMVPVGSPGELFIGGEGLALGYINQEELTRTRFIDNPFASGKLYKTGDKVRWLSTGVLEYLGRNDQQVKIRGFRIELAEIENALHNIAGVLRAVVLVREYHKSKKLVAYAVAEPGLQLNEDGILAELQQSLPEFMIPSYLVLIADIPVNANGKLDARALPDPIQPATDIYVMPKNPMEVRISKIWLQVLGRDNISVHDNFFRIGGDSIISIQLVTKLRRAGFQLQVKDIFDAPTIAQLANHLSVSQAQQVKAEQGELTGRFDLLPIQQWFFQQELALPHHWNQAFMVRVPGNISTDKITTALAELAKHHDVLRCRFECVNGKWQQRYDGFSPCSLPAIQTADASKLAEQELHELLSEWQSDFDYQQGPLWRAALLNQVTEPGSNEKGARLFFAAHHLIIDGVSWRILAQDFGQLLTDNTLGAKTSSYRQWVQYVSDYPQRFPEEQNYWQKVLYGYQPLPAVNERSMHMLSLDADLTHILLFEAPQGFNTQINDLLLSALALALEEITARQSNHIILEGHGREVTEPGIDLNNTVGWFTSTWPVQLQSRDTLSDTIIYTKEMLRGIPNNGLGFGAFNAQGTINAQLPEICFNYLGQLSGDDATRHNKAHDNLWELTSDALGNMIAPENRDDWVLNINGAVKEGQLQFGVISQLSLEQSDAFVRCFEQALEGVILEARTQAQKRNIKTPTDFIHDDILLSEALRIQNSFAVTGTEVEQIAAASSLQQGFVYHHLSQPQDDAYRVQLLLDYHLSLDIKRYQEAWRLTSLKYPALRMGFDWKQDILQVFSMGAGVSEHNFVFEDVSHMVTEQERRAAIDEIQQTDRKVPFNLAKPGLVRIAIIKQSEHLYTVLITQHHAITDGWSSPVLLQTLHQYYELLERGMTPTISADNAYYQAQKAHKRNKTDTTDYWHEMKQQFSSANDISLLLSKPIDFSKPVAVEQPTSQTLILEGRDYQQLKFLCREIGVTLNALSQFIWHKLLHCYSNDDVTIVGTTVSGRDIPVEGIDSSVGMFINTLPLAVNWQKNQIVAEIIKDIQHHIAMLNSHSGVSLSQLQGKEGRLFHSLFVFENYPALVDENTDNEDSVATKIAIRGAIEKVDLPLCVMAFEDGESLHIKLGYCAHYLEEHKAQRLLAQLRNLFATTSQSVQQPHSQLFLIDDEERQKLAVNWNQTEQPFEDNTLHGLFEARVRLHPQELAITFEAQSLTYEQLDQRANQLARAISARINGSQDAEPLVVLYLDRSIDTIVAILATLKAGAAYIPVSPDYPDERTAFILQDTQADLVVTQSHYQQQFETCTVLSVQSTEVAGESQLPLNIQVSANRLAYIIYTSGTTGKPKGVMVEHKAAVNTVNALHDVYDIQPDSRQVGCFCEYVFDVSISEIFNCLGFGGQLHLFTHSLRKDPQLLSDYVVARQLNYLYVPPAILALLPEIVMPSVRAIIFAGEPCDQHSCLYWAENYALYNFYGPTEAAIYATGKRAEPRNLNEIGRPIKNTRAYVLDREMCPTPVGVPGELYLAGNGLARGYYKQPQLTTQRFVDTDFGRLYKTGDVVRWLADQHIEYLGRNDFQLKIRGFRIETGEIEQALASLAIVKQAVVIPYETKGVKQLVAYVVLAESTSAHEQVATEVKHLIAGHLTNQLPDYMIPAAYTIIDSLPLNINGKLDRKQLPAPEFVTDETYVEPASKLEEQLCALWLEILKLPRVGTEDNFFRIGGNSISAIQIISQVNKRFNCMLSVADLFTRPTISEFAQQLQHQRLNNRLLKWLTPKNVALPKMFMMHPGGAGCEVYKDLALALSTDFECIGIENFNMCSDELTGSLQDIAAVYRAAIIEHLPAQQSIHLLGWSLGGSITLELATQLEREGFQNIHIYLLDTHAGDTIGSVMGAETMRQLNKVQKQQVIEQGISQEYAEKVFSARIFEAQLAECQLSNALHFSQIHLFKAGQVGAGSQQDTPAIKGFLLDKLAVPDNGIAEFSQQKVNVIRFDNNDHHSLLANVYDLTHAILNQCQAGPVTDLYHPKTHSDRRTDFVMK